MRSMYLACLCVAACCMLAADALHESLNFVVPPLKRKCFYQDLVKDSPSHKVEAFIISGKVPRRWTKDTIARLYSDLACSWHVLHSLARSSRFFVCYVTLHARGKHGYITHFPRTSDWKRHHISKLYYLAVVYGISNIHSLTHSMLCMAGSKGAVRGPYLQRVHRRIHGGGERHPDLHHGLQAREARNLCYLPR